MSVELNTEQINENFYINEQEQFLKGDIGIKIIRDAKYNHEYIVCYNAWHGIAIIERDKR